MTTPTTGEGWVEILPAVADDIGAFEARSGPLPGAAPAHFATLPRGRLYDVVFGPGTSPARPH